MVQYRHLGVFSQKPLKFGFEHQIRTMVSRLLSADDNSDNKVGVGGAKVVLLWLLSAMTRLVSAKDKVAVGG